MRCLLDPLADDQTDHQPVFRVQRHAVPAVALAPVLRPAVLLLFVNEVPFLVEMW
jgi:hypothetical protein